MNASNQINNTGFSYDVSGNMSNDGTNGYGWDAESQIKSAAGVNYTYDGDGNRVQKSNGKLYWYGAGSEVLDESDLSGNSTDEYVFFGGKRIAHRKVASGEIDYYFADHLGTSRIVTNASGTVLDDSEFYPFGGERPAIPPTSGNNYKFTGKERDAESGAGGLDFAEPNWRSAPSSLLRPTSTMIGCSPAGCTRREQRHRLREDPTAD